ncbi:MAG TPA: hypothetical protein VNT75_09960 [Symbiobacteriaceae bacterium]|nr:hypothetical protein [Symbiobacteriaceae bacterium]
MANQNTGPQNEELRPFQGGTDSLTAQPTKVDKVRSAPYAKFEAKDVTSVSSANEGDTAASPAMMAEPD